jgi:hypothetical protein
MEHRQVIRDPPAEHETLSFVGRVRLIRHSNVPAELLPRTRDKFVIGRTADDG